MSKPALKVEEAAREVAPQGSPPPKHKLPALLVTADDGLWAELGSIADEWVPKQVDSIDELIASFPAGGPGVVLWDSRGQTSPSVGLSRLQLHSDRLAVIALDDAANAALWQRASDKRQVAATIQLPIAAPALSEALQRAREEIDARMALLGGAASPGGPGGSSKKIRPMIGGVVILAAVAAVIVWQRLPPIAARPVGTIAATPVPTPAGAVSNRAAATAPGAQADEKVDSLIERAQQAMLDRHYLEPAEGSALSLYRDALVLDPGNGEASQGLARLAGILIARVQSALDERKFDAALQALETARSLSPDDVRLAALDERIASVRNELGTAQIQAAVSAQNFDRADQLIDEAARAKTVSAAKLAQMRDDVRHRREQTDLSRLVTLIDARLQQDRLLDPRDDNAHFYLNQARQAGASAAMLTPRLEELRRRLVTAAHSAIEQHRFADADRYLVDLHNEGTPTSAMSALQHDLAAARAVANKQKTDTSPLLDLARARLAQGNLIGPDNDSALYYLSQLRVADPQNSGAVQLSGALQAQIVERARAALNSVDFANAEALLHAAASLGPSADVEALNERLLQAKPTVSGGASSAVALLEVSEATLTRTKKLKPQYPYEALSHGVEGWVVIGYTITAAGKVADARVIDSSPPKVFDAAGLDAVNRMRYQPYSRDGKAMPVASKIRVTFRLTNQ